MYSTRISNYFFLTHEAFSHSPSKIDFPPIAPHSHLLPAVLKTPSCTSQQTGSKTAMQKNCIVGFGERVGILQFSLEIMVPWHLHSHGVASKSSSVTVLLQQTGSTSSSGQRHGVKKGWGLAAAISHSSIPLTIPPLQLHKQALSSVKTSLVREFRQQTTLRVCGQEHADGLDWMMGRTVGTGIGGSIVGGTAASDRERRTKHERKMSENIFKPCNSASVAIESN